MYESVFESGIKKEKPMPEKKERLYVRLLALSALVFLLSQSFELYGADLKIKVIVRSANIRLKPSLDSPVIGKGLSGQVFTVIKKIGEWYSINLPPDKEGIVLSGFVHQSVVQEMVEDTGRRAQQTEPKPEPEKKAVIQEKEETYSPPSLSVGQREDPLSRSPRKKFFVRLGGGYASKSYAYGNSWDFSLYHEEGHVTEGYSIDSSGTIFDGGVGFYFFKNLAIEISFVPASGKTKGTFSASFPHPLYFNSAREKTWENAALRYAASEINLNLLLAVPLFSKLDVYFSLGGTYFSGIKIENLKVINWNETGYPYFDLSVSPQYSNYSNDTYGFNAGGGLDFYFTPNLGLNINVRYSDGEAEIEVEGNKFTIKAGGLRATGGIKFTF